MEYVVIKTGGRQYKVSEGNVVDVARLHHETSSEILLKDVLLHVADEKVSIGAPVVESVTVKAKILEHLKGEKVRVSKFKAKSRYRKTIGFRPYLTRIQIEKIETKLDKKTQSLKSTEIKDQKLKSKNTNKK